MDARLLSIHIYPVKSCAALDPRQARLGPRGLEGDRDWVVVGPGGRFLTQRTHPKLATIRALPTADGLALEAPGVAALAVPTPDAATGAAPVEVTIWNDRVAARSAGAAARRWISEVLGTQAELVRADDSTVRAAPAAWRGAIDAPVHFPDAFPILVTTTASLAALNERMPVPVPMNRFRPNLVLDGPPAFAEDELRTLRIGEVELRLVKPCTRCATTAVDQARGVLAENPLPVLKTFRFDRELLGVTFGQNAVIVRGHGALLRAGAEAQLSGA